MMTITLLSDEGVDDEFEFDDDQDNDMPDRDHDDDHDYPLIRLLKGEDEGVDISQVVFEEVH